MGAEQRGVVDGLVLTLGHGQPRGAPMEGCPQVSRNMNMYAHRLAWLPTPAHKPRNERPLADARHHPSVPRPSPVLPTSLARSHIPTPACPQLLRPLTAPTPLTPHPLHSLPSRISILAGPLMAQYVIGYSSHMIDTSFIGRLDNPVLLSSMVLGGSLSMATGYSVISGLASASETLSGQAHGAKNPRALGATLQRSLAVSAAVLVPITALWCNAEHILLALGQEPDIAAGAARWGHAAAGKRVCSRGPGPGGGEVGACGWPQGAMGGRVRHSRLLDADGCLQALEKCFPAGPVVHSRCVGDSLTLRICVSKTPGPCFQCFRLKLTLRSCAQHTRGKCDPWRALAVSRTLHALGLSTHHAPGAGPRPAGT